MIGQLSHSSRRFVALGLVLLLALLAVQWVIAPVVGWIGKSRDELEALRAREMRLLGVVNQPEISVPSDDMRGLLLPRDEQQARSLLTRRLTDLANSLDLAAGPVVIAVEREGGQTSYVATWSVSGIHDSVLRLISDLERGRPLLRARSLRLQPLAGRDGELSAELQLVAMGEAP